MELYTEIVINIPPKEVWATLSDLANYRQWNEFILPEGRDLTEGTTIPIVLTPPGQKAQRVRVKLTKVHPFHELRWLGHFHSIPGLIDGRHIFQLEPTASGGTLLIHREEFSGLLVPFVWSAYIKKYLLRGFQDFNLRLKTHLESQRH